MALNERLVPGVVDITNVASLLDAWDYIEDLSFETEACQYDKASQTFRIRFNRRVYERESAVPAKLLFWKKYRVLRAVTELELRGVISVSMKEQDRGGIPPENMLTGLSFNEKTGELIVDTAYGFDEFKVKLESLQGSLRDVSRISEQATQETWRLKIFSD